MSVAGYRITLAQGGRWLFLVALFLLPWQTRWIFGAEPVVGELSEFGVLSFFVVEVFIVLAFLFQSLRQKDYQYQHVTIWGWLFLLTVLATTLVASNRTLAIMQWMHVCVAYLLFLQLLERRIHPRTALTVFCLGLILPSLLGIYQAVAGASPASTLLGLSAHDALVPGTSVIETFSYRWLRAYGSFQHPNVFGGYLAVGLIACLILPRFVRRRRAGVVWGITAVLFLITLILTYSRSAWVALALSIFIAGWIVFTHHRAALRRLVPLGLILLIAGFFTATLFINPLATRFDPTARLETKSIEERLDGFETWKGVMYDHGWRSWIGGVGVGNYVMAQADTYPDRDIYAYQPVHNVYLLLLGEIGVIGLILMVLWLGSIDRINYRALPRLYATGALAMGNTLLIIGFFDHYIWSLWPGLALLAFVMGMTLRLSGDD